MSNPKSKKGHIIERVKSCDSFLRRRPFIGDTHSKYPKSEATLLHGTPPTDPNHKTLTGTVIHAGDKSHPFNLWMDHAYTAASERIKTLIERRYSRGGRNYCREAFHGNTSARVK